MQAVERAYKVTRNEFFISVAALAISIYNGTNDIRLSWIYNGRDDMLMMNSTGLLFRDLPVGVRLKDQMTMHQVFEDVNEQVREGIEHSCYPYIDRINQVAKNENAYLLYQQDMRGAGSLEGFHVNMIDIRQNQAASQTILDMEILDGTSGPELMIDYAASRYQEESINKFKDLFVKVTQVLATHLIGSELTVGEIRDKVVDNRCFLMNESSHTHKF